jgi:hypothetical protein
MGDIKQFPYSGTINNLFSANVNILVARATWLHGIFHLNFRHIKVAVINFGDVCVLKVVDYTRKILEVFYI